MRHTINAFPVIVLLTACAATPAIDTEATRREAAARYLELTGGPQDATKLVDAMTQAVPEKLQDQMRAAMTRVFQDDELNKLCLELTVKHYTTQELEAMTAYHSSPLGKSATKKTEAFMAELLPAMMARMKQVLDEELQKNKSAAGKH